MKMKKTKKIESRMQVGEFDEIGATSNRRNYDETKRDRKLWKRGQGHPILYSELTELTALM